MKKRSLFLLLMSALTLASCGKKDVTPPGGKVESVSISQSTLEVQIGKRSGDVSVTIEGKGDYNKNVKLVSENEAVAKASFTEVESGGTFKVYGIAEGNTKINLVSLQDETKATSLSVSVKPKEEAPGVSEILSVSLSKETHLFHLSDSPISVSTGLVGRGTFDDTVVIELASDAPVSVDKTEVKGGEAFSVTPVKVSGGETSVIRVYSKQDNSKYAELIVRVDEDIEPITPESTLKLNAKARTLKEGGDSFKVIATVSAGEVSWSFKEDYASEYVAFDNSGEPQANTVKVKPLKATPGDTYVTLVASLGTAKAECKIRVAEKETEYRTYYVSKNAYFNDYQDLYFYTWDDNDQAKVAWPGEKLTESVKNTLGEDCYSFTVDTLQYTGFLFNDGGDRKTIDTPYAFVSSNNVWYDDEGYHFASIEKDEPNVSFYTNSVSIYSGEDPASFGFNIRKGDASYEVTSGADKINVVSCTNGSIVVEGVAVGNAAIRVYIPGEPGQEALAEDYLYVEVLDPSTVTTFYFSNNKDWEKVFVYAWNDSEAMNWPGVQCTNPLKNKEGEDVYLVHVPAKYDHLVMNCGDDSGKTSDINLAYVTFDENHNNMYPSSELNPYNVSYAKFVEFEYEVAFSSASVTVYEGKNARVNLTRKGDGITFNIAEGTDVVQLFKTSDNYIILKWLKPGTATVTATLHGVTATLSVTCSAEEAPDTTSELYFTNNKGWSEVYIYAWGEAGSNGWPGEKLEDPLMNTSFEDVYVFEIDEGLYDHFILNNNDGSQTVDVDLGDDAFETFNNIYLDGDPVDGKYDIGFANFEEHIHSYGDDHFCECGGHDPAYTKVTFKVNYDTGNNGNLYIVLINDPNPQTWMRMTWSEGNNWYLNVCFAPGTHLKFKAVVGDRSGDPIWEADPDRQWDVPDYDCDYTVNWQA